MWNSQVWQADASSMASTGQPVAWNSKQMKNSGTSTTKLVIQNSVTDVDLETAEECNILSAAPLATRERVNLRLRAIPSRPPRDEMEGIDKHSLIW